MPDQNARAVGLRFDADNAVGHAEFSLLKRAIMPTAQALIDTDFSAPASQIGLAGKAAS